RAQRLDVPAGVGGQPGQLGGEERVALGPLLDGRGHLGGQLPPGGDGDQLGDGHRRQAAQREAPGRRRPRQGGQRLDHGVVAADRRRAQRGGEEDRGGRRGGGAGEHPERV